MFNDKDLREKLEVQNDLRLKEMARAFLAGNDESLDWSKLDDWRNVDDWEAIGNWYVSEPYFGERVLVSKSDDILSGDDIEDLMSMIRRDLGLE